MGKRVSAVGAVALHSKGSDYGKFLRTALPQVALVAVWPAPVPRFSGHHPAGRTEMRWTKRGDLTWEPTTT